jgi:hypothetical protein
MKRLATQTLMDNGFLQRFLITTMTPQGRRPAPSPGPEAWNNTERAISCYTSKRGVVECPPKYLQELFDMFDTNKAPLMSHWMRLVNEYGPRFAVMLSVNDRDQCEKLELAPDCWERAALLVRWFYCHGVMLMGNIAEDETEAKYERFLGRIFGAVKRHGPVSLSSISHRCSHGTTSASRKEALEELIERGAIRQDIDGKYVATVNNLDSMQEGI